MKSSATACFAWRASAWYRAASSDRASRRSRSFDSFAAFEASCSSAARRKSALNVARSLRTGEQFLSGLARMREKMLESVPKLPAWIR